MEHRLPPSPTQAPDRSKELTFYYRNRPVRAYEGETIASALLAAGFQVFSRSFKYHRPRGPFCLAGLCARCAMQVDGVPNVRTCQTPVREGMQVEPQNVLGGPELDLMSVADRFSWAMPTGFYLKRFHKPKFIWPYAAKAFRRLAPGGSIRDLEKEYRCEQINLTPEVLVVGGGRAGLEAALITAKAGVRVVLVETEAWLGGRTAFSGEEALAASRKPVETLWALDNVTILTSTTASAVYPDGLVVCSARPGPEEPFTERIYLIRPRATIIAAGASQRPLVFDHNDRPGIILGLAAQRLVHLYALAPGEKILVAGGDDDLYRAALDLDAKGLNVVGLADYRPDGYPGELVSELAQARIAFLPAHRLTKSLGGRTVEGVQLVKEGSTDPLTLQADSVIVSGGQSPLTKLLAQAGARMAYDPDLNLHLPVDLRPGLFAAGRVTGLDDGEAAQIQGRLAGAEALAYLGLEAAGAIEAARQELAARPKPKPIVPMEPPPGPGKKRFVCFCSDVTTSDLDTALVEGFDDVESAKRYTTATMGPCQGGMCQANFTAALARLRPEELGDQPLTTPRPPAVGVSFGALAGWRSHPSRITPLHRIQERDGAVFIQAGAWKRADHFGAPEEEIMAVHTAAGLADVSTLGKFRVYGPDAERLLDRVYVGDVKGIEPHRLLYTAALNEEGSIIDDGVILKRGENDYLVTTSTARAPMTREWLLRWMREEDWRVWIVNLTDAYGGMNLAGPKARDVLAGLASEDVSNAALPFMGWREMFVSGAPALVFRMGFLGELSFEIHVPSARAEGVWAAILAAGKKEGVRPVGLETQFVCRLEKGHAIPGLDIDGNTSLIEAGWGWLWDRSKPDPVGGRMLRLLEDEPPRQRIIGFALDGRRDDVLAGLQVVADGRRLGHLTSVRFSPLLKQTIGLASVVPDRSFDSGRIDIRLEDGGIESAWLVEGAFYDPEGERMKS